MIIQSEIPSRSKKIHNLLVIGNGLDINAGLKSKFSDFFDTRYSKMPFIEIKGMMTNLLMGRIDPLEYKNNLSEPVTIWDYVFLYYINKTKNSINKWINVEEIIKNEITSPNSLCRQSLAYYKNKRISPVNDIYLNMMYNLLFSYYTISNIDSNELLESFLLDELKKFENSFCIYLKENIKTTLEYKSNLNRLFEQLTIGHLSNVINFNYTDYRNCNNVFMCENVHGSLLINSTIFGIDGEDLTSGDFGFIFTKTYRKLETQILENYIERPKFLKKNISNIIFYGHSLGTADHSYFQAIFDYYSISNSAINIVFAYSVYDYDRAFEIKYNYLSSVISLLEKYRETIENTKQKKNLIHRLLIEKRLYVCDINELDALELNEL